MRTEGVKTDAGSAPAAVTERDRRELVHYEQRGGVALLTFDDPPTNSYTHEMMLQLDESKTIRVPL